MTMMRAMAIAGPGGPEALQPVELPLPLRINSEVLVRVHAASVNPIDTKTRAGRGVSAAIERYPAVLGHDFSGVVVQAPYDAHPLKVGDEVFGMVDVPRRSGSYAEYVSVPAAGLARKPSHLSHVEAAAVPLAALTAWGMVVDVAKAHEGQRMLVHAAAGGVGHFAVQLAAYFGAQVFATASQRNADWLRQLGAAEVIDYTTTRFDEAVRDLDVVIDLIGNVHDDTGSRSLKTIREGGLIINAPTGSWPTVVEDAAAAGIRATGFTMGPDGATLAVIARLLESGDLHVGVERVFELAQLPQAHAAVESGHTRGKIAIAVTG